MKKLHIFLMLVFVSAMTFSQTTTTSNLAVFDGNNNANGDPVIRVGDVTNGGYYQFRAYNYGGGVSAAYSEFFHMNGTSSRYYITSSGNGWEYNTTLFSSADGTAYLKLEDFSTTGVSFTLPKSNSRLLIGSSNTNTSHKLIVDSGSSFFDGNVGIGTESFIDANDGNQEYKLSVDGKIRAEALKVYTTWADFVFEKDYNLPSLYDVEKHIEQYGHLKDIPSAKVVEEKGIDVGEMHKLLLQKIEELTLYTLQQEKRIHALENKLTEKQ